MADTQVLGTCVFGRAGSSPASRTHYLLVFISRADLCLLLILKFISLMFIYTVMHLDFLGLVFKP